MKKIKPIWIFLVVSLFLCLGVISANGKEAKKEATSDKKGVTQVKIEDGEIYIKTEDGKEVKLSTDELGDLPDIEEPILEETEWDEDQEYLEDESEEGRTFTDQIVKMSGNIIVDENEVVRKDVVAIGGNITVKGKVRGDVVAVGGKIRITSTGFIQGDAVSIGGGIRKEPGGVIRGETVDILGMSISNNFPSFFALGGAAFIARIIKIGILLLLAILVFSIVPKNVEKIKNRIDKDFWVSLLVGFAIELLIGPVFLILLVLLCITIVGIPVAVIALPLATVAYFLLAYTSGCYFVGSKIKESNILKPETPTLTLIVGILAVEAVLLLARVIGIASGILSPLSLIIGIFGIVILWVIVTVGLGAGLLTRFGTRPKDVMPGEKPNAGGNNYCQPNQINNK